MTGGDLLVACAIVTAMLGTIAAVGKAGVWFWATMRKLARLADDLTGEPPRPGMPEGRPGVLDRLSSIEDRLGSLPALETRLAAVEAQLQPNGGGSLRDAVDRLAPEQPAGV